MTNVEDNHHADPIRGREVLANIPQAIPFRSPGYLVPGQQVLLGLGVNGDQFFQTCFADHIQFLMLVKREQNGRAMYAN